MGNGPEEAEGNEQAAAKEAPLPSHGKNALRGLRLHLVRIWPQEKEKERGSVRHILQMRGQVQKQERLHKYFPQ